MPPSTSTAGTTRQQARRSLTLFALALGSFCIGTSEFASMGILQLFSVSLGISLPTATNAITAYAFGVVIGAPAVTLAAASLNRRTLLLCLMVLFVVGNVLSSQAANLGCSPSHVSSAVFRRALTSVREPWLRRTSSGPVRVARRSRS